MPVARSAASDLEIHSPLGRPWRPCKIIQRIKQHSAATSQLGQCFGCFCPGVICSSITAGSVPKFRSFPELMPVTKKDLPDLASINPHDLGIWAIWVYVGITKLCVAWSVAGYANTNRQSRSLAKRDIAPRRTSSACSRPMWVLRSPPLAWRVSPNRAKSVKFVTDSIRLHSCQTG